MHHMVQEEEVVELLQTKPVVQVVYMVVVAVAPEITVFLHG
jgi:hypothetical protein